MPFEFAFLAVAVLLSAGLCGALLWGNLFKKVVSLSVFSSGVIIFYLVLGFYKGASAPIFHGIIEKPENFVNPLPSVLMLTAIVVGISVQAIAFALVIKVRKEYGSLEEREILEKIKNEN